MKHAALNKVYRLVWNTACQCWQAVSECARSRTKGTSTALISTLLFSSTAFAGPTGGEVTAGQGTINQTGSNTTITQQTPKLAIDWNTFSIGQHESVNFNQPSASSIALNRVTGAESSSILGSLIANGQVWVLNPNGVLFGTSAQVNVGGLIATTLQMSNENFLSSNYSFSGTSGQVENQGSIKVPVGGTVALIAPVVRNNGTIVATQGNVLMAAAEAVTITPLGSTFSYTIDRGAVNALVENGGLIQADAGRVVLTAQAKDSLTKSVTNNTGIIEANTIANRNGTILLLGDMKTGTVNVAGKLEAAAPNGGDGGFIETSAAQVKVADSSVITTSAPQGKTGQWLIDPADYTIAATGGDITGTQLGSNLASTNVTILSTAGAAGVNGDVNVNDAVNWATNKLTLNAQRNININSNVNGSSTAQLALEYGQGALAAGNSSTYNVNAAVNLPAGNNFSTKLGSDGSLISYTVITDLGAPGGTTGNDLQGMNGNQSGNYALGSNIDASATSGGVWGTAGFNPIGNFTGTFDGLGHAINNLTINRPATNYLGLFGVVGSNGIVRNVGMVGGSVSGSYNYVGGLVGFNSGTVSNAYTTGSVSEIGGGESVGGLVGRNVGTVSNSYATGTVSASYATGSNGGIFVGGLVGGNLGLVSNSYATGSVTGNYAVGGLVGLNNEAIGGGTVNNSYATGKVIGGGESVGGLVGFNNATVSNSYWNINTSGQTTSGGGTGLTTAQMKTASNFTGFNFTTTPGATGNNWVMVDTDGTLNNAGGAAGGTFPMLASEYSTTINNAHQLQLMAMNLSGNYTLGQNIDAAATGITGDAWSGSTFIPVGTHTKNFGGIFDGLGHTISNLVINMPANDYVGLFGESGGIIKNVGLVGGYVTGNNVVGGLLGRNNYGTISNSYALEAVTGVGYYIGGLVGANFYGTISNSHATGAVSGNNTVGGLVGNGNGSVINSYASGDVSGGYFVGGLMGVNNGTVNNSFATGKVMGSSDNVGGLVGYNQGTISNSYTAGMVTGSSDNVGGLVGYNNYGAISNSYSTGAVISSGKYVGGLVGYNKDTIINSYSTGAIAGNNNLGGLVGYNVGNISSSYSNSEVTGVGDITGGLVGFNSGTVNGSSATGAVAGAYSVGGLVGYNTASISNSFATAEVTGSYYVGGLVGFNIGDISNTYTTGTGVVSGNYYTGGLVGYAGGTIRNSYATKNVTGAYYVGGLVGRNSFGTISNTYATGSVTGNALVGGLVGENFGKLSNSYATGLVAGSGSVGGLIGEQNLFGGTVSDSFWNINSSGQTVSAGGIGLTNEQMKTQANFTSPTSANGNVNPNWDFANTWIIYSGHTDPLLRSFMTPLTVTANSAGKTYDGLAYNGSNSVTYSTTPNGNLFGTLSYSGDAQGATNAGSYAITANGLYSNQQGYSISYVDGALTIDPRSVDLTGSRFYDGTSSVASGIFTLGNLVSGEILSLSGSGSVASKNVSAGTQAVTLGTLALTSVTGLASNYTFTGGTQTANITPLAITANPTVSDKIYDGNTTATLSNANNFTGKILGDDVAIGFSNANFDTKNVGINKTVTVTGINLSGADAANYSYSGSTTQTDLADITPKALSIIGFASANKVYDGKINAKITNAGSLSGVVAGDNVSFTNVSATFDNRNAGINKTVTLNGVALGGIDAANYSYSAVTTDLSDITPKLLTINGFLAYNKIYDGTNLALVKNAGSLRGIISGDVVGFYYSNATFADQFIGWNKTVTLNGVTLNGTDSLNYLYTGPTTTRASITAK